jgi:thiamine kinase-like enzyme
VDGTFASIRFHSFHTTNVRFPLNQHSNQIFDNFQSLNIRNNENLNLESCFLPSRLEANIFEDIGEGFNGYVKAAKYENCVLKIYKNTLTFNPELKLFFDYRNTTLSPSKNEFLNLINLNNHNFNFAPIPGTLGELKYLDLKRESQPRDLLQMSRCKGISLAKFIQNKENLNPILTILGSVLHQLHTIKTPNDFCINSYLTYLEIFSHECSRRSEKIFLTNGINSEKVSNFIDKSIKLLYAKKAHFPPCLIHHDLWEENIMVDFTDNNFVVNLIDWENSQYGLPGFDLGNLWLSLSFRHNLSIDPFLNSYGLGKNNYEIIYVFAALRTLHRLADKLLETELKNITQERAKSLNTLINEHCSFLY